MANAETNSGRGKGYGWRLSLGMLLPSSNPVAEPELTRMLPEGVSLLTTRLKLAGSSREELLGMTGQIEGAVPLLCDAGVDRIVFNCTAVSTFDVEMGNMLRQRIEKIAARPATSTADGVVAGLKALGAKRIALITPIFPPSLSARRHFSNITALKWSALWGATLTKARRCHRWSRGNGIAGRWTMQVAVPTFTSSAARPFASSISSPRLSVILVCLC